MRNLSIPISSHSHMPHSSWRYAVVNLCAVAKSPDPVPQFGKVFLWDWGHPGAKCEAYGLLVVRCVESYLVVETPWQ